LNAGYQDKLLNNRLNINRASKKIESLRSVIATVDRKLKTNTNVLRMIYLENLYREVVYQQKLLQVLV